MTSRIAKVSRTSKTPAVQLVCPACRAIRRCQPVGTGTVRKIRRELVECLAADCGLIWAPARTHLTAVPTAS